MSVQMCSENHLSRIAEFFDKNSAELMTQRIAEYLGIEKENDFRTNRARIVAVLHSQNAVAYLERYPAESAPPPSRYVDDATGIAHNGPLFIAKLCLCYEYQAADTPEYPFSVARDIIHAVICGTVRKMYGYNDLPWGI